MRVIAFGIAAWLLLAVAVGLIAFSVGEDLDTTWTPWPTKVVFDWLNTVPSSYRFLAAAMIGCCGGAMAVAAVRRYKAGCRESDRFRRWSNPGRTSQTAGRAA